LLIQEFSRPYDGGRGASPRWCPKWRNFVRGEKRKRRERALLDEKNQLAGGGLGCAFKQIPPKKNLGGKKNVLLFA